MYSSLPVETRLAHRIEEEKLFCFSSFDLSKAHLLGEFAVKRAKEKALPLLIEIFLSDRSVFRYALAGTSAYNDLWLCRKKNTVSLMQKSSLRCAIELEKKGKSMADSWHLSESDYAACGGGFPLLLADGTMVGIFLVSGLPNLSDHQFLCDTLAEFFGVSAPYQIAEY